MKDFHTKVIDILNQIHQEEESKIENICHWIVEKKKQGGTFYVIGTGHSHMVAEEFYARAGGLANIQMIAPLELTLSEHPKKSTYIERVADYAGVITKIYDFTDKDIIMICSNSGRNQMPIEFAIRCKAMGVTTIALTNFKHSSFVESRHASGKRLFEVCDTYIDNHGEIGDAMMQIEGVKGLMGATSSITGVYIAQIMNQYIAEKMVAEEMEVPVFVSSNLNEGDKWNQKLMEKYYHVK
ncbi:MAG: SIS domain-containing protein [Coprobacillaceae bacterium]